MEITAATSSESIHQGEQDLVMANGDEQNEITGHFNVSTRKAATRAHYQIGLRS